MCAIDLQIQFLVNAELPVQIQTVIEHVFSNMSRKAAAIHIQRLIPVEFMNQTGTPRNLHIPLVQTIFPAVAEFLAQHTAQSSRQEIDIVLPDMDGVTRVVILAIDMEPGLCHWRSSTSSPQLNIWPASTEKPYPQFEKSPRM